MSFLLENSKSFLRAAGIMLEVGEYNLALFHLEQALQLCLKYKIYEKYGDFPKTHSLKRLLSEVGQVAADPVIVDLLEDAYISSRYLPVRYSKESAQRAYGEVEKVLKALSCL
ncbi:MAG: HEPN domain-containing protein [Pyrobaculum arsenaticum]|uniref:HEPN domain protein n=2 Tax=Pyrobaculum arsenaticum TaxID=121277 RepID=A4WIT6_PYRAR|nr:HEPN domain-containing protein [Pyrobaculum arsenaticum]ABP50303.1 HEPN domain protein [Pyrobaculum arsenaticum DSM 13514]MCY0890274.1 HEPN domain-containing protein [Pyrobaculum arsenaticum]NYR14756.1 HEPN domain-containing protein [Pyrobaculum arsenaticum]